MLGLQKVEPRDWALLHIDRELFGFEDSLIRACLPRCDELIDYPLGFTENLKICLTVKVGNGGNAWAADDDRLSTRTAQFDHVDRIEILRQHAAGHHQVGPFKIAVGQHLSVSVDQPDGSTQSVAGPLQ